MKNSKATNLLYFLCAASVWWFVNLTNALAQPSPPPQVVQVLKQPPSIFEDGKLKPDAFFLLDKEGNPILIPRASYEDYERFLRQQNKQVGPGFPGTHIDSIEGSAKAFRTYVEIQWRLQLSVNEISEPVVRIPLGLKSHVLVAGPSLVEGVIRKDTAGALEWFLPVEPKHSYEVRFTTKVKKTESGPQSSIKLDLVESPTRFSILFEDPNLEVSTSGPTSDIEIKREEASMTANVIWSGGQQVLTWQRPSEEVASDALELESTTRWAITNENDLIAGSTRFSIKAFGKKSTRVLHLQLPTDVRWNRRQVTNLPEAISVTVEDSATPGDRLLIRFSELGEQMKEEFTLEWERSTANRFNGQLSFDGIGISGVQRHDARLELDLLSGDRLSWTTTADLSLLSQARIPSEVVGVRHTFRVINPSYHLTAFLQKEENRVVLRPTYLVRVGSNSIQMRGSVEFGRNNPTISDFRLHLGRFRLDRAEFDGRPVATVEKEGAYSIAILESTSTERQSTSAGTDSASQLIFSATMTWPEVQSQTDGTKPLVIDIPELSYPNGESRIFDHGAGELLLAHDRNLRLLDESLEGLLSQNRVSVTPRQNEFRKDFAEPGFEGSLRSYRFENQGAAQKWIGRWIQMPSQVAVRRSSTLKLDGNGLMIQQNFELTIENDSLPRLQMLIPKPWIGIESSNTNLKIVSRSQEISWSQIPESASLYPRPPAATSDEWALIELSGGNWLGKIDLELQCQVPIPDLSDGQSKPYTIPLAITPEFSGIRKLSSIETLSVAPGIYCEIDPKFLLSTNSKVDIIRQIAFPEGTFKLPCTLKKIEYFGKNTVQVDRAWLQTIVSDSIRRDRFVVRMQTSLATVEFILPENCKDLPIRAWLDGKPANVIPHPDGRRLAISLENKTQTSCVIDLWITSLPVAGSPFREIKTNAPEIQGANVGIPFVWQLIVPPHETLFWNSSMLVPQYRWTLKSLGLSRESTYQQQEIETWVGASPQPGVEQNHNQYILSGLGTNQVFQVWVVPRVWVWLPIGTVVLFATALWYRFQFLRHPLMLVVVAGCLAILIPISPDLSILLYQTLACSSLIVLTIRISRWAIDRRVQRRTIFRSRPSTYVTRPIDRLSPISNGAASESASSKTLEGVE